MLAATQGGVMAAAGGGTGTVHNDIVLIKERLANTTLHEDEEAKQEVANWADAILQSVVTSGSLDRMQDAMNYRYLAHFRCAFKLTPQTGQLRVQGPDLPVIANFVASFNNTIATMTGFTIQPPNFHTAMPGNHRDNNENRQKALQIFAISFTVYTLILSRVHLPMEASYTLITTLES